eukprot:scaffold241994_cov26-Tisochrysis_lutea.AAC.3
MNHGVPCGSTTKRAEHAMIRQRAFSSQQRTSRRVASVSSSLSRRKLEASICGDSSAPKPSFESAGLASGPCVPTKAILVTATFDPYVLCPSRV